MTDAVQTRNPKNTPSICPCGTGLGYDACCARYLEQGRHPEQAEALMRSRYTAYTLQCQDYLLESWHPDTRPAALSLAYETERKWLGLIVKRHEQTGQNRAIVEFVARFKIGGRAHRLHEISRFICENGRWFYVDGDVS